VVACANIANMMLSRALAAAAEISIRACNGSFARAMLISSCDRKMMLSAVGGLVGLALR